MTQPFPGGQGPTSVPVFYSGYWLRPGYMQRVDDEQWDLRVPAGQLAGLAGAVDAAERLGARRELLASRQNAARARLLRESPELFGVVGRVVLGVDERLWRAEPDWGGCSVELSGIECIDGFQTLGLLAQGASDLSAEHLDRAVLDVRVVGGAARDRARTAYDLAHRHHNPTTAQDLLLRHPVMARLVRQFEGDGIPFRLRRGERRGPSRAGYAVGEATTALAFFAAGGEPALAFRTLTPEGREEIWRDTSGPDFRALFGAHTEATGVRIAITFRRAILDELVRLLGERSANHWHLLADAPDLVVWAVARELPLDALHRDLGDVLAPEWERILDLHVPALTRSTAERLVAAYRVLRPRVHRKNEVQQLEWWVRILDGATA
ncbi:hypothetical protein ACIQF6_07605 [Kitasatospora sp. NPDC092948]|uniref:hypothetical protein n=1 Tax=Kitasatospora sp. NPDC092948 TaxID=3364088 RepID=UPI0037F919ED